MAEDDQQTSTEPNDGDEPQEGQAAEDGAGTEQSGEKPQEGEPDAWSPERAKAKISKINGENAALRKRVAEAPKADDVAAKDRRIGDLETSNLRLDVGYELGLPKDLAVRLQGGTREEMVADAEKLVELVAPKQQPNTHRPTEALKGGQEPDRDPEVTNIKQLGERMFAR